MLYGDGALTGAKARARGITLSDVFTQAPYV